MSRIAIAAAAAALILATPIGAEAREGGWEGRFFGGREVDIAFSERTGVDWYRENRLFATRRACEAWLYRLRSEYQMYPRIGECRRAQDG
jgi:hypothetical protein